MKAWFSKRRVKCTTKHPENSINERAALQATKCINAPKNTSVLYARISSSHCAFVCERCVSKRQINKMCLVYTAHRRGTERARARPYKD